MKNKNSRLEVIKMILSSQEISSQEALLIELDKAGFRLTQATLSRDLKQLKVVTMTESNRAGLLSVKFSGNILVMHTLPGHASHIAYDIDNAKIDEFIGTIAGDDTIFLVMAENVEPGAALKRLAEVVPNIK